MNTLNYPGLSSYCYVGNSPILFIDPDGRIIDIGNLTDNQKAQYAAVLAKLSKSELHNYIFNALESSQNTFKIVFVEGAEYSGKYNPETGTISINPEKLSKDASLLSEEMFHGYQNDRKDDLYPNGVSPSNLETEGDLYKLYVQIELDGPIQVPSLLEGQGLKDHDSKFNFENPSSNDVNSKEYSKIFKQIAEDRTLNAKKLKNQPDSYTQQPSNTPPNSLRKVFKEASGNDLKGPKLENGDYYAH